MDRPRLRAHLVTVLDGDIVFLIADDEHYLVRGAAPAAVLPYLDGRHTVAEIAEALSGRVSPMQVFAAVRRYESAGHLVDGRPDLADAELAFWDAQGIDPGAVVRARDESAIRLVVGRGIDAAPVKDALAAAGVRRTENDAELTVVLAEDYLDPALAELNRRQLDTKAPWLLAKPGGLVPWLGPAFYPGSTGCWACAAQRLTENRQVERYLETKRVGAIPLRPGRSGIAAGPQALAGLLATEVMRVLATNTSTLAGSMVTLDLRTLQTTEHALVRRPQCPECGDPELLAKRNPKIVLTACPAVHTTDGGYRVQPPQATFARLQRHISPYLGAITRLAAHGQLGNGMTYSFTAGHNFAMVDNNIDLLRRNLRGQSGGKGRSEIQAKVSAVCEAIERYSAVWREGEPVRRASYDELGSGTAVHVDGLLNFSPAQFETRAEWNQDPRHRMHLVPDPFRTDIPLDWTAAWSLTHQIERYLPSAYVWYGHPDLQRHFYCVGDSNGCASGNTVEEAILQGACELVERDAVAVWWYNRLRAPGFDLDSLGDPYVQTMREFYASMDRDLWALDLTSDLGVPTFAALSHRDDEVEDIMMGFGAHPDPAVAAMRALTELNQFLPSINKRDTDGKTVYWTDDQETLAWCRGARLAEQTWLLPDPDRRASVRTDYATPDTHDLADHVHALVARARAAGLELLVLDQSQPDLDLSVVKVISPGLRHFWRRLGPGRLYDVPVRSGRRTASTAEQDMNPWNVFF